MAVIESIKSRKTNTIFEVQTTSEGRCYLLASGEASTNPKVIKQLNDVRIHRYDVATTLWIARQLSNTY